MFSSFKTYLKDFLNLFYPNLCVVCNQHLINQEKLICTECLYHLPKTNFHLHKDNPVSQIFWGRVPIEYATGYFFFHKGSNYQHMMHKYKYHGYKEIRQILGKSLGNQLKESYFCSVDVIVPVPLHKNKLKKRGYNQSEWFGLGLAEAMGKPIDSKSFVRAIATETQTRKTRFERWKNVEDIFTVLYPENLVGKHILLVDDVVTTGATLEACAHKLLEIPETKISIATLAVA